MEYGVTLSSSVVREAGGLLVSGLFMSKQSHRGLTGNGLITMIRVLTDPR